MALASDLNALFEKVEKLKLERYGYVLGHSLNSAQMNTSTSKPVEAVPKEVFKFKDRNLYVVAHYKVVCWGCGVTAIAFDMAKQDSKNWIFLP